PDQRSLRGCEVLTARDDVQACMRQRQPDREVGGLVAEDMSIRRATDIEAAFLRDAKSERARYHASEAPRAARLHGSDEESWHTAGRGVPTDRNDPDLMRRRTVELDRAAEANRRFHDQADVRLYGSASRSQLARLRDDRSARVPYHEHTPT